MKYIKYFLQFLIILVLFIFFKFLGYKKASTFGSSIGKKFGKFIRSDRVIIKNISYINEHSKIKTDNPKKIVEEVFSNYGRILSDYVFLGKFRNSELKDHVKIQGLEILEQIKKKNKPVVFISGHFNNFELMAMFIDAAGINLSAIYRPLNNIFLNPFMVYLRKKFVCKNQIKKGINGVKQSLNYMEKNYSIALMVDQRLSEGAKVPFFNELASTTSLPAQLAIKFKCDIIPIYISRKDGDRFKMEIMKPIKINLHKKNEKDEITKQINELLEKLIVRDPSQWILTHNRWK